MGAVTNFLLCSFVVVLAQDEVKFEADMPFLRVKLNYPATLECCYSQNVEFGASAWVTHVQNGNVTKGPNKVTRSDLPTESHTKGLNTICNTLTFNSVQLNDTALYRCHLQSSTNNSYYSHGTYLQVYKPMEKTLNLSENTKNKILTAEGILLLLCVLLPATTLLCQSRKLQELEKKKMKREEENIYQGLNLDDCCATYDQIERSHTHGPYQDVCNITEEEEEEEEIQLEKP